MRSALYYPFTDPKQESFLKTALFLWDTVDFIVPYRDFRPYGSTDESIEALEIIGRNYVPTAKDKQNAHRELEDICTGPLPGNLRFELDAPERAYGFYPEKLLPETWQMLADTKLARIVGDTNQVRQASTKPLFGYYMMSVLAVCCSQERKRLVTDENDPYRALANLLVDSNRQIRDVQRDWYQRLIVLRLNGPDFAKVSLRTLVNLRKKEGALLQDLRQNFLDVVDRTAADLCLHGDNPNTVRDLIESFNTTMERDLVELKRALRHSAASILLSKEFAFSILAATTTAATLDLIPGVLTIGGLTKGLLDYRDRRRRILRQHPSSWLFTATGPSVPIV